MKKRVLKILCVLILVVFAVGILAGCSAGIFNRNNDRFRNEKVVMTIGQVEVTMNDLVDWFEMQYMQYSAQASAQVIWDALFPNFIEQRMMINEVLLTTPESETNRSALAGEFKKMGVKYIEYIIYNDPNNKIDFKPDGSFVNPNATNVQWLINANDEGFSSKIEESDKLLVYILKSVYVSLLDALNSLAMTELETQGFVFDPEETETTRDEMIDRGELVEGTLWTLDADFDKELKDLDKKLKGYPVQNFEILDISNSYIFAKNDVRLVGEEGVLEKLNERLNKEDDEDLVLTADDYIAAQRVAVTTTLKNLRLSGNDSMNEYIVKAIKDQVLSQVASSSMLPIYSRASASINKANFNARLTFLASQFEHRHAISASDFESYIRGLNVGSYIYGIPGAYQAQYHFVVNLLLPFSSDQTSALNTMKTTTTATDYRKQRLWMAKEIEIKDFLLDGKGEVVAENPFDFVTIGENSITVNGGWVGDSSIEAFKEEVYRYNTDPGALNPTYGYVIGLHEFDLSDRTQEVFVREFADAARELAILNSEFIDGKPNPDYNPTNTIACVTDFGIHIMFYAGVVVPDFEPVTDAEENVTDWLWTKSGNSVFDERYNFGIEGGNAPFRFYRDIYNEIRTELVTFFRDEMLDIYKDRENNDRKVFINENEVKKYLNTYQVEFENKYLKMK